MIQMKRGGWSLSVANGGGLPTVDRPWAEPFVRGPQSTGSGLGLAIVRQVARQHKGEFTLSQHASRVEARLTLPAAPPP